MDAQHGLAGIDDLLCLECVRVPLQATNRDDALRELVDCLYRDGGLQNDLDRAGILDLLMQRESVGSTAIGGGVALPHAKIEGLSRFVMAAGVSSEELDFEALDDVPVRIVFLLLAPHSNPGGHIRLLSQLSKLAVSETFYDDLLGAENADAFQEFLVRHWGHGPNGVKGDTSGPLKRTIVIPGKQGVHLRTARDLASRLQPLDCRVSIEKDGQSVDGKSILGVMTLAAEQGSSITCEASGPDAAKALDVVEEVLNDEAGTSGN